MEKLARVGKKKKSYWGLDAIFFYTEGEEVRKRNKKDFIL